MKTRSQLTIVLIVLGSVTAGCADPDGFHFRSQPTLSLDRGRITASVSVRGIPSIYDLSLRGNSASRLTDGPDVSPAVSPDHSTIVFARRQAGMRQALFVLDRRTQTSRALTDGQTHDDYPVFVDDHTVAFLRARTLRNTSTGGQRWVDWDVFVADLRTAGERRVTSSSYWESTPPSLVPGTASVLLTAGRLDEPRRPILVDLNGGGARPVGLGDDGPVTAVDAQSMVVLKQTGTDPKTGSFIYNLFESSFDGSRRRQLTDLNTRCERPYYQRDVGLVLFLTNESGTGPFELWQTTLDGKPSKMQVRLP